ncbi:N-(5'-phosphoribosyl)anthranilate isomerase [Desulfovibrio sp. X2]|uniref:phosphoribosylanthranilate isomerase n=1 Tax=Desulfovibrio sp. X2 TaxID=941449 RepID=UPI0003589AC2|nr:phosphoribosylanthranilate isomerase [Desulfovibrio sp. X2]EPR44410.1 N-(5'-phosphoribosyl)anthranilate isomerase [Desulfovibrio sp. X2]
MRPTYSTDPADPADPADTGDFEPRAPHRLPPLAVQAAGVRSPAEARMLASLGVDLIGFPLRLPVHTPDTSEEEAAAIIREAGIAARACCITYETDPAAVAALCAKLAVSWVQLHAVVAPADAAGLRALAPGLGVIASLVVADGPGGGNLSELLALGSSLAPHVDAFITDTFDPSTGARGATGKVHDWSLSAALARGLPRPLILAGGLTPNNVAAAVRAVRPAGVDAHTGLEDAAGNKDRARVAAFVAAAKAALSEVA